jgi:hypothetical protein
MILTDLNFNFSQLMTNQELFLDLKRSHERLEVDVAELKTDLLELRSRWEKPEEGAVLPPLPLPIVKEEEPPPLPPKMPPLPVQETREVPNSPPAFEGPGFELQFGRWLARIGVVFALFTLIFFSVLVHDTLYKHLGPWSKLTVLALVSSGLVAAGLRMEKRDPKLLVYGRTLAGGGLACLYYTLYGATYVPQLHVISSPLLGGFLLLAWSAAVLGLAKKRQSELLSIFAISLAYFSSVITPGNGFTMGTNLLLALTAVIFLVRNGWTGLPYLCLVGTYAGFLRQAVVYRGPLDFQWSGSLLFWPSAVYLTGAWVIFTTAILLSRMEGFAAGKRMAFLCLNNGAWAGLLIVASQLGTFGHLGGTLGTTGGVLLGAYLLARVQRNDAGEIAEAYLAQGLLLGTAGVVIAYSGMTRGLLSTVESVFLVAAGAYSRNLILRIAGAASALLSAAFLANELIHTDKFPWVLTFGGALALLANAWLARRELWREPREIAAARTVGPVAFYVMLALSLLAVGVFSHAPVDWIAPDLALIALGLAATIYIVPLFELPPLSQALLVLAQVIAFVPPLGGAPASQGLSLGSFAEPLWSRNVVALVTMILVTWWPRQKLVRTMGWFQPLSAVYALAMVAFCSDTIQPHASEQTWMVAAALLSLVFLAYGAWSRLWTFMAAGQILLGLSIFTFLNRTFFPWSWWAAAIPIGVVFGMGWGLRELFPRRFVKDETSRQTLRVVARVYQSIATGLLVRWVFGIAPEAEITLVLSVIGTAFVAGGIFWRSGYGIRSGLVLGLVGICHYVMAPADSGLYPFTWMDAGAFASFLAQPALLRRWGRELITPAESWATIMISSAATWLFISNAIAATGSPNLTLGWTLVAVTLIILGFVAHERRQRWCGLAILVAAFVRVAVHDFWIFSDLLKVLTFLVLTVICLGLSFLYYKFGDRLKNWL